MLHRRVHGYRSRIPIEYNKTGEGVEGSDARIKKWVQSVC
jgi:hypothetical protein